MRRHLTRAEARAHDPINGVPRGFPDITDLPVGALEEARTIAHAAAKRTSIVAMRHLCEQEPSSFEYEVTITAIALALEYVRRRARWEAAKRKKELGS
jgi:hypothetical protein